MKKIIPIFLALAPLLFLASVGLVSAASITITSPSADAVWDRTQPQTVNWSTTGVTGNERVRILFNTGGIFVDGIASDGRAVFPTTGQPDSGISDFPSGNFSISARLSDGDPPESIFSPRVNIKIGQANVFINNLRTNKTNYTVGETIVINWETNITATGDLRLERHKLNGDLVRQIIPTNLFSFTGTIGDTFTVGESYYYTLSDVTGTAFAQSDNFIIENPTALTLTLTSPTNGMQYRMGDTIFIRWTAPPWIPFNAIMYLTRFDSHGTPIGPENIPVPNTGSYNDEARNDGTFVVGTLYYYRLVRGGDSAYSGNFTITENPNIVIASSSPPDGAIDARDTSKPSFQEINLTFSGSATGVDASDFSILSSNPNALTVGSLSWPAGTPATDVKLSLSRGLKPQERVTITYNSDPSKKVCLGFLPGDVNGDGTTAPGDELELIDALNGQPPARLIYSTDINRSGLAAPADIIAIVDLLNPGPNGGWNGKTLPACDGASPAVSIFISHPSAGTVWQSDFAHSIMWTSTSITSDVVIKRYPASDPNRLNPPLATVTLTDASYKTDGQHQYTVPPGTIIAGSYFYTITGNDFTAQSGVFTVQSLTLLSSFPPDGAIDARDTSKPSFQEEINLTFSGPAAGVGPSDFAISSSDPTAQSVTGVTQPAGTPDNQVKLSLSRGLKPQERVTIKYTPDADPNRSKVCLGFLPGDVNGDGTTAPADELELIDALNGAKTFPIYSTDIDRSGLTAPADIIAMLYLLNTSGVNGSTLPACDGTIPDTFCGNGQIDDGEACDGDLLNGQTCQIQGFPDGGTLFCNATCTGFDTNQCSGTSPPYIWHEPQRPPPDCNPEELSCYPPINVSTIDQDKNGPLELESLFVNAGAYIGGILRLPNVSFVAGDPHSGQFLTIDPEPDPNSDNYGRVILATPLPSGPGGGIQTLDSGNNGIQLNPPTITATDGQGTISLNAPTCDQSGDKLLWNGNTFICGEDLNDGTNPAVTVPPCNPEQQFLRWNDGSQAWNCSSANFDTSGLGVGCNTNSVTGKVYWNGTKFVCGNDRSGTNSSGTVTSITAGEGLRVVPAASGGTVTTSGTISLLDCPNNGAILKVNANGAWVCDTDDTGTANGVTKIIAGNNINITSTGTHGTGNVTINATPPDLTMKILDCRDDSPLGLGNSTCALGQWDFCTLQGEIVGVSIGHVCVVNVSPRNYGNPPLSPGETLWSYDDFLKHIYRPTLPGDPASFVGNTIPPGGNTYWYLTANSGTLKDVRCRVLCYNKVAPPTTTKADLYISSPTGEFIVTPANVAPGQNLDFPAYQITNGGGTIASGFKNALYFSTDSTITATDIPIKLGADRTIEANDGVDVPAQSFAVPIDTPAGTYYVGLLVDYLDAVDESNEGNNSKSTTVAGRVSVTVAATTYTLTTTARPGSSGTFIRRVGGVVDNGPYAFGTQVVITANPATDYAFDYWADDCAGNINTCTLTMDRDKIATAYFGRTLTLIKAGAGLGTVVSSPLTDINCGTTCSEASSVFPNGQVVTLTATPANVNHSFSDWWTGVAGECPGTGLCTITMNNTRTVTASFNTVTSSYTIVAQAGTGGTITPSGSVSVARGDNQAFSIAASSGYTRGNVYVDAVNQGAISSYSFNNVQSDHSITANFTANATNVVPTVTTPTATSITSTSATLGANVTSLGIPASISARGTCLGTSAAPTTNCVTEGGNTTGVFTHTRAGFSANTTYYYRGYADNTTGRGYSADATFTTKKTHNVGVRVMKYGCDPLTDCPLYGVSVTITANSTDYNLGKTNESGYAQNAVSLEEGMTYKIKVLSNFGFADFISDDQTVGTTENQFVNVELLSTGWSPDTLPTQNWKSVAMSGDGVYRTATVIDGAYIKIYSSTNSGTSWIQRAAKATSSMFWRDVAMSNDGKYQTAVMYNGKIWRSAEHGYSWDEVTSSVSKNWAAIAVSYSGQYQTAVAAGTNASAIYRSTDYGVTWTQESTLALSWADVAMSRSDSTLTDGKYQTAVVQGGQIYRSSNFGDSWSLVTDSPSKNWASVAMSNDGTYRTATGYGEQIYISINNGVTWTAKDVTRYWDSVAMSGNGQYQTAAVYTGRVYISTDYGVHWSTVVRENKNWDSLAMSEDGRYQTVGDFNHIYRATMY